MVIRFYQLIMLMLCEFSQNVSMIVNVEVSWSLKAWCFDTLEIAFEVRTPEWQRLDGICRRILVCCRGERDIFIIGILYWHMFTKIYTYRCLSWWSCPLHVAFHGPCHCAVPQLQIVCSWTGAIRQWRKGTGATWTPFFLVGWLLFMFKSINSQENQLTNK